MKYYDVNGIQFSFKHETNHFFKNNLEKYEIEKCEVSHHIETILVPEITIPEGTPNLESNNKMVFQCEEDESTIIFQDKHPILFIEKKHDYKTIYLFILEGLLGMEEIEYVYTGILFMELCLYHSMQSIHGSAVIYKDKTIIFSGPSGIGKSTHVEYWKEFDPTLKIINDDKPILLVKNNEILVSGSPWSGKTKVNLNVTSPLHSIVFLEQGTKNEITELSTQEKIVNIMRNINRPRQDVLWEKVSSLIDILVRETPMYRALVTNDIKAVDAVKMKLGV